jgi:amidase
MQPPSSGRHSLRISEVPGKRCAHRKEYLGEVDNCRKFSRKEGFDAVMDKFKLDTLVAPTGGPAWITDLVCGDDPGGGSSSAAAVASCPSVSLPAGFIFGLPVGIEATLLKLAYSFKQASKVRKPPRFLPTIPF